MTVIPLKYLHSLCELRTQNNDPLAKGHITDINNEYLEITFSEDSRVILVAETLVKINIFNETLGPKVFIGRVYIGSDKKIRLIEIVTLMDFEKRDFFRINIYQQAAMYTEKLTVEETYITTQTMHQITINNISLSGLFFLSTVNFEPGDFAYIMLELATGNYIFECKIFRVTNDFPEKIGYGCEFSKLPTKITDSLYRYIHEKQVEYIKSHI